MITVLIEGKSFIITPQLYSKMGYFQEWRALESGKGNVYTFPADSVVTLDSW